MTSFVFTLCVWAAVLVVCKAGGTLSLWDSLNVGVVQYPLVGLLSVDQLTYKVRQYVAAAAEQDTQLLVLPELFSLDLLNYSIPETDQFDSVIDQISPEFINNLQQLSVEFNMYILAGSVPAKVQKQIRNRSYLLAPNGKQVYQEKLFLTPDEVDWGWEGSDELSVIDTPWGTTAITICYDSEFPLISNSLAQQNVDVILIPSQTGEPGFTRVRWAAQARAIEHMAYVVVTGTTGCPADGWEMKAQGAVLGPSLDGFTPLIAEGVMDANAVVFASLDLAKLREAKAAGKYCPAQDQRTNNVHIKMKRSSLL